MISAVGLAAASFADRGFAVNGVPVGNGVGVGCGDSCASALKAPLSTTITTKDLKKTNTLELLPENGGFFKTKADCNIINVYGHLAAPCVTKIDESPGRKDAQNLI